MSDCKFFINLHTKSAAFVLAQFKKITEKSMFSHYYKEQEKFYVSVDCIILGFNDNKLYLLLTKRKFDPLKGQGSLMGGFLHSNENLDEAAHRVVNEYTGLTNVYLEQVGTYGDIGRDTGERVVSVAYYALINMEEFNYQLYNTHDARWIEYENVGTLVFDHNQMLNDALGILRRKAATQPLGFNLLPEKFTLPQLQSLYEAIYQSTMDKRNFRKKMLEMNIFEKLEEKDKSNSKRGAFLYKFNKNKYDKLLENNFYFSV